MANNDTEVNSNVKLPEKFFENLILSFSLSMLVGLIIGALIWLFLTWLSRRKASARISGRNTRQARPSSHNLIHCRSGMYRNSSYDRRSNNSLASAAALTFQRQASLEQPDPFARKPSFRASTFHPLLQCSQIAREAEESNQSALPRSNTGSSINTSNMARPESFWSNSSLRGFHATHTPPPAYETVIRAFQETCN
ncbi:myc target protein 1 homolog [Erpetoichthys calabaricus]|uniref:Myc target 1a n=1 Tax=Erpetoichthys calabaricus TaxID=27687 RepID=A0A8C4RL03_ERPCA|nr:myc target protein 1 homolog [Erpetoichthys calabaricus]